MQHSLKELKTSAEDLISQSFPLLQGKKINIFMARLQFYAFSVWIPPLMRIIVISKKTRNFSRNVITGLLVHELCHQERYLEMGIKKYILFAFTFMTSRNARASEEKSTDRLSVEKGYGRELYELSCLTHKERKNKKFNELYMSPEEIRAYAESIDKWNGD